MGESAPRRKGNQKTRGECQCLFNKGYKNLVKYLVLRQPSIVSWLENILTLTNMLAPLLLFDLLCCLSIYCFSSLLVSTHRSKIACFQSGIALLVYSFVQIGENYSCSAGFWTFVLLVNLFFKFQKKACQNHSFSLFIPLSSFNQ